jgi:hypothetical protein
MIRATRKPGHYPDGADLSDGLSDFGSQSDKTVSRETILSGRGPKPYKAKDCDFSVDHVRSIGFCGHAARARHLDGPARRRETSSM